MNSAMDSVGTLYLVPTPVGNLGDLAPRSIEILQSVQFILAEDTRTTAKLSHHFNIETPLKAFHQHNEHKATPGWIQALKTGQSLAVCSDAGTPGISDPAFLLVRACVDEAIPVICLPGPTAFVPALVSSGIPCDRFVFEGFLPHKKGRQKRLQQLAEEERTLVFYESPHRVVKLLEEIITHFGEDRWVACCREISKLHEQTLRGTSASLLDHFKSTEPRGEFVVVVAGSSSESK
ncbi:MAG: 16S rRNA (cytidine(1402)-2'-O)-methyltransferase [Bacteroidetes bacterium]|nr:16S rRNA (cytidine(1402)-2'-O)-methyltransferase [Bacteroidota bacterium]